MSSKKGIHHHSKAIERDLPTDQSSMPGVFFNDPLHADFNLVGQVVYNPL